MSVRLVTSEVVLEEGEKSEEVAEKMEDHLAFYAMRHPEFSYIIKEDRDKNTVIVKTVTLDNGDAN